MGMGRPLPVGLGMRGGGGGMMRIDLATRAVYTGSRSNRRPSAYCAVRWDSVCTRWTGFSSCGQTGGGSH